MSDSGGSSRTVSPVVPATRPARGRPRDARKPAAILAAARKLFLERPSDGITMEQIAAAAGVSRTTLYAYFADRDAVLEAMVHQESERNLGAQFGLDTSRPLARRLTDFGESFIRFMVNPDTRGFEYVLAIAALQNRELARRFFEAGPGHSMQVLDTILRQGAAEAALEIADFGVAASDLVGLWQGFLRFELDYDRRQPPSEREIRHLAAHGVAQFMRLYAA